MKPEEFKRQLDELQRVVFHGSNYYAIWKALWPSEEVVDILNRHKGFFVPVREALRGTLLIEFAKVFDGDSGTISLPNLLGVARRKRESLVPHATAEDLRKMSKQLSERTNLRSRLKRMRDQHLAHLDAAPSGDTTLPVGEIDALLADIQSMLNDLSRGHDRSVTAYSFQERDSARNTGYILRALKKEAEWIRTAHYEEVAEYLKEVWGATEDNV